MISKEKSYNHIKELIYKYEITKNIKNASINHIELDTYYQIGKELKEAGKNHGEKVLIEYAEKLENEFNKKYSRSSLIRYRQFYDIIQNGATVSHLLTWSHYYCLLGYNDHFVAGVNK